MSDFLPAMRALVAKELINNYGMTQTDVAKKMDMTQPAISYYLHELRGIKVKVLNKNEKVMDFVNRFIGREHTPEYLRGMTVI